jgi:hypothetical protein
VKQRKKKQKADDSFESVDLSKELQKCRIEMKGPYLDKDENKKWRQKQREAKQTTELEERELQRVTPVVATP